MSLHGRRDPCPCRAGRVGSPELSTLAGLLWLAGSSHCSQRCGGSSYPDGRVGELGGRGQSLPGDGVRVLSPLELCQGDWGEMSCWAQPPRGTSAGDNPTCQTGLAPRPVRAAPLSRASACCREKTVLFLCRALSGSRRPDTEPWGGCWVPGDSVAPAAAGERQPGECRAEVARGDTAGTEKQKVGRCIPGGSWDRLGRVGGWTSPIALGTWGRAGGAMCSPCSPVEIPPSQAHPVAAGSRRNPARPSAAGRWAGSSAPG